MNKFILGILLLTVIFPATAAEHVALVIGNSAYPSNGLRNPTNDARDLSVALKKLDFDVIPVLNGNKKIMNSRINMFLQKINNETKIALFFYSGHGSQYRGVNYLIPVDANLQNASTLPSSAITAQSILRKMDTKRAGLNILVLDACRTSPYKDGTNIEGKSVSQMKGDIKGLSRVRNYSNTQVPTLVAYATSPGMIAKDGVGKRNSPYTEELLKYIKQSKIPISQIFNNIAVAVRKKTNKKQIPWNNMSAIPNLYLHSKQEEQDFWLKTRKCNQIGCYQKYLQLYPRGKYASLSRTLIQKTKPKSSRSFDLPDDLSKALSAEMLRQSCKGEIVGTVCMF